ncbi:pantoate--beta-alanine ligase [Silvibacterium dinghuense]|uniref:Pantothenate synthetase n=1 Tax=Silvibacterium dinghuense TaxID=1560006 RepID=A0A4Q1SA51_9BACT|nr:pantoate--beta-alanine ligase [Silvibacterium dinghuense]RXS93811.1 pantoate--beta-alanine ligase [Silvibacterium dinghuense]GGH07877.1 pantothenate synthetase [Silvibacterium dinghuense]
MQVVRTVAEVRAALVALRAGLGAVGFVPTMGALHEGHLSLVRAAKEGCGSVIVSIFVNPTQFGPNEDFAKYPRTFEADCALLEAEGVDLVFAPQVEEMYPQGAATFVEVEGLSDRLDGASRPGHFRGVATVVAKLFHIVQPTRAYFGQKDAAQVAVLRRMVRELHFPLELVACATVREADGLAMSSRNRYLSVEERKQALVLKRALDAIAALQAAGERDAAALRAAGLRVIEAEPAAKLDYLKLVHPLTLEDVARTEGETLVAVAAWIGSTRLIDNVVLGDRV